ncbi:MAG: hypothetical protein HOF23_02810 [Rhodospirillaceae bacterium]|jgi:hypothetical protein|nr:hypothetical protein [Rhodospirillaceae bacterium]
MSANIKILGRGHWREKRGTVNWVSCGSCEGWFHVNEKLLGEVEAGRSYFHCSHCQEKFGFEDAREIIMLPAG